MPCFHPRDLVINKPRVVYEWKMSESGRMVRTKNVIGIDQKYTIQVPCGRCLACLAQMQSQWSFRIENEALYGGHAQTLFVTYTYDNENLPEDYGLHKEEMQKYLHDLRQNIFRRYFDGTDSESVPKIRYYICGEYGSKRGRPHFHAMLFLSKSVDWRIIQESWNKGIVDIRPFTPARAGYVAKYSVKQLELDYEGRPRPFHMQSQGLGKCFLAGKSFESLAYNTYWSNQSGHMVKLPRYYLDKLGTTRVDKYFDEQLGKNVKLAHSFSYHSFAYYQTQETAQFNYLQKERIQMSLLNLTFAQYDSRRIKDMQNLELNLQILNKKSYYYAKSASECGLSQISG